MVRQGFPYILVYIATMEVKPYFHFERSCDLPKQAFAVSSLPRPAGEPLVLGARRTSVSHLCLSPANFLIVHLLNYKLLVCPNPLDIIVNQIYSSNFNAGSLASSSFFRFSAGKSGQVSGFARIVEALSLTHFSSSSRVDDAGCIN